MSTLHFGRTNRVREYLRIVPLRIGLLTQTCIRNRVNIVSVNTLSLDAFHGKFTCHVSRKGLYGQITPLHAMHGDHLAMGETVCVFYHFGKKGNRAPLYALPHIPALPVRESLTLLSSLKS